MPHGIVTGHDSLRGECVKNCKVRCDDEVFCKDGQCYFIIICRLKDLNPDLLRVGLHKWSNMPIFPEIIIILYGQFFWGKSSLILFIPSHANKPKCCALFCEFYLNSAAGD